MARGAPHLRIGAAREQAVAVRMGRVERLRRYGLSRRQLAWLFFLPAVLVLLGTDGYPAARTVWMSLHTIRLDEPWLGEPFVGLHNYGRVLQDANFWGSFGVSIYFTVGAVVLELLLGLCVALVVNESFRGRGLMRAAMLVPWAIPAIVSARMWGWMFSPGLGAFNGLLNALHIVRGPIDMLGSPAWAMPALIIADTWKNTPFVALLLRTLTAFQTFDLAIGLTQGGPGTRTELLSLHAYRVFFSYVNFGQGATLAVIIALICFVIAALYARQLNIEE